MDPRFFFELSGELKDMPAAEAGKCIEAETEDFRILEEGPGYLIASFPQDSLSDIADRVALTHSIGRYIGRYDPSDISNIESAGLPEGSFAIRAKRFRGMMKDADSQKIIRDLGEILSKHNDVNLKDPDTVVKMHMSDGVHVYIEERVTERDLLEKRKVSERPFFSPISLHPKYARALINLTGAKRGSTILDPFCGTGGIVIEAAEMGMNAIASDFDDDMVIGCRENMDFYGLELKDYDTIDISKIPERFGDVDRVVTDPPYGRSTKTGGEEVDTIHSKAMEAIPEVLVPNGKAGLILPYAMEQSTMVLENMYVQRVHGSLSRHYHVFGMPQH